jgi:AcrR family transcriptional regulator
MRFEEESKLKILEKARDQFLEHGYRGASLRNIAAQAGMTTGALYHHFRGKDELFVEVCLHGFELMDRKFKSAEKMTQGLPPAERILAFFDAYVSFFFEHADYYELIETLQIDREKLNIPEPLVRRMDQASAAALVPMVRVLSEQNEAPQAVMEQVLLLVAFAEGLFQCKRKGLLDRMNIPFGNLRRLVMTKLPGLLEPSG